MINSTAAKFQVKIEAFPKDSGDLNIVCSSIYAEYMIYVRTLQALLMPQTMIKRGLTEAVTLVDNATYDTINGGLGILNTALTQVLPKPFSATLKLDANVAVVGNMLALTCSDFLGSLPQELFNIFQDIKHGINKLSQIAMPGNIMMDISKSLLALKDEAMKEMFGTLFTDILSPIIDYDMFLQDNGVADMIKRLQKMERCMTKKGICGRPKSDFMEPTTHKLWSTYFKSQFLVSSNGSINIKSYGGTSKQKSQMSNLTKSMNSFRLSIK